MAKSRRSLQVKENIRWPKGKRPDKLRKQVSKMAGTLLTGRVLAIDPASGASSPPGWAIFEKGELVDYGVIEIDPKAPIQWRLDDLHTILTEEFICIDVLILEEIRGKMAHVYLHWACGVTVSCYAASEIIEMPISFWKAITPEGYEKSDDTDAAYIGLAAITLAKELHESTTT